MEEKNPKLPEFPVKIELIDSKLSHFELKSYYLHLAFQTFSDASREPENEAVLFDRLCHQLIESRAVLSRFIDAGWGRMLGNVYQTTSHITLAKHKKELFSNFINELVDLSENATRLRLISSLLNFHIENIQFLLRLK